MTLKYVLLKMILHHCVLEADKSWGPAWPGLCQSEDLRPEVRGQEATPPQCLVLIQFLSNMWFLLFFRSEVGVKIATVLNFGTLK